jgi:hypothetical protein
MNRESPDVIETWCSRLGVTSEAEAWSVGFSLSTVPMENWFYKRKALRPEDLKLELTVPSYGLWLAELRRHDNLFLIQWRPNGDFRVESSQLKYKKIIKWPVLNSLYDFPLLVEQIEKALSIKFIRHANIGTNGFVNLDSWVSESSPKIQKWLAPCADSIGTYLASKEPSDF